MPKVLVNGINIHYQISGQGPDLVLIHGATGNMAFWYLSSLAVLVQQFRVTTYDLRGHGYSDVPPTGYTSADMAADLYGLLDHLEIRQAHLLGHSFGGVVALHAAAFYPERVASLILADPEIPALRHLCNIREWPYWEAWKTRLREFGVDIPDDKWDDIGMLKQSLNIPMAYGLRKGQKRKSTRLLQLLENTTALSDFREIGELTMAKISQVEIPTLAIYGELSPFLPVCHYLIENMPDCKSVIMPKGHYHPALEPEKFVKHVIRFLHDPERFVTERLENRAIDRVEQRSVLDNIQPQSTSNSQNEKETGRRPGESQRRQI